MRRRVYRLLFLTLFVFGHHQTEAKEKASRLVFTYEGHPRTVFFYVPASVGEKPIVVLLHGSGRDGTEMLYAWKHLAASEQFILAAPNASDASAWDSLYDSPAFLHAVVDQVSAIHPVDRRRIYLFGHSGGAVYALALAAIDPEFYAATAVHAGAFTQPTKHLFVAQERHMPIAIWVGDRDLAFPLRRVAATKALFDAHGFDVQVEIVKNHGHDYAEAAEKVNAQAWQFFEKTELPSPGAAE